MSACVVIGKSFVSTALFSDPCSSILPKECFKTNSIVIVIAIGGPLENQLVEGQPSLKELNMKIYEIVTAKQQKRSVGRDAILQSAIACMVLKMRLLFLCDLFKTAGS